MKILIRILPAIFLGLSCSAATISKTITGAATTNLITGSFHLLSLTLTDSSGTNNPVKLFDAPGSTLTVLRPGYTNRITYATNIVITVTNYNGVVQNTTNAAVYTIPNNVVAVTNSYNTLSLITVPLNSTVTLTPIGGLYGNYGLTLTNLGTYSVTITYSSTLP